MEYIIAMWFSAWLIQLWTIFRPIWLLIPKGNMVMKHKYITGTVMVFVLVPLLLLPMMSDIHRLRFQNSFLKGLIGER
jgi:hypothetical protein